MRWIGLDATYVVVPIKPNTYVSWSTSELRVSCYRESYLIPPVMILLTIPRRYFFCESVLFVFVFAILSGLFHTVMWSSKVLFLALLHVICSCAFVPFPYGILDQVWYLIVSFPGLCILSYFGVCHDIQNVFITAGNSLPRQWLSTGFF